MVGGNLCFGDMEVASEQWTEREKELAGFKREIYGLIDKVS